MSYQECVDYFAMRKAGLSLDEILSKVGPNGYIHGWIYVGAAPAVGESVSHPTLGAGKVTSVKSGDHITVQFDHGSHSFDHKSTKADGEFQSDTVTSADRKKGIIERRTDGTIVADRLVTGYSVVPHAPGLPNGVPGHQGKTGIEMRQIQR